jgi:ATP-dependent DNA helicase RecG
MTITRLGMLEMIANGENSSVEFKRDAVENHKLAKLLVGFANFAGGAVLIGVDDDGVVVGTTRSDLEAWVMQVCRDKVRPEIIPSFHVIRDVTPGRDIAIVAVEPGYAVHHSWHDDHRTYFIRVGSLTREASTEELERLMQQRGSLRIEMRPLSGTGLAHLDRRRLREYFSRVRQQEVPDDDDNEGWVTLLRNTELMEGDRATMAGVLLFGRQVNRFLPQAGITAASYPGRDKDYDATRSTLRGPLVSLHSAHGLEEAGVVAQALSFVRAAAPPTTTLIDGQRVERAIYPEDSVRELVVNAVIHRDYSLSGTDIELAIYSDRLEVTSPGILPNGITPDRMRAGCRVARNQLLKDVMRDYGYLESVGMGIPRKVMRVMQLHNGTVPTLVAGHERFTVTLFRSTR